MRIAQPWKLRGHEFSLTAMRSNPVFRTYDMPKEVRRAELKRRLFRVNHPKADRRTLGPRSREAAMWTQGLLAKRK